MGKLKKCSGCGKSYIVLSGAPKFCQSCSKAWNDEQERKREEAENLKWQEQRKRNQEIYEREIQAYDLVSVDEIHPSDRTLYIIGNGFDLLHRVPSSYYNFRDSLGKNSSLRRMLETTLTPDDIWADFEESLAHPDLNLMGSRSIVDMWLDIFGVYSDEDAGAAEYCMAIEAAANPIINIVNELQPAFRRWVEKLKTGTDDRPLKDLIRSDGKVLCFNYTEFAETLYGAENVCYIHGCRKRKGQKLILGHRSGIESEFHEKERKPKSYRQAVIDAAQREVFDLIMQYDKELLKDTDKIICEHKDFFEGLGEIDQVIVIGHSVSLVDWDYFAEVNKFAKKAVWNFGCFGLKDLRNIEALAKKLGIENYSIFRTDGIRTKPNAAEISSKTPKEKEPNAKKYRHEDTIVTVQAFNLQISESANQYEVVLPDRVRRIVFIDDHLFVILNDLAGSILLFNRSDGSWNFTEKLEEFEHQGLVNRRLNHVFISEKEIVFVYNNRVRKYDLQTGEMLQNQQIRNARNMKYKGRDMVRNFTGH